jgi:predicted transcriptional regulator
MATRYDTLKVQAGTKERLRYVAAIQDRPQSAILDEALAEYIENHADRFRAGIDRMTAVLRHGEHTAAAQMSGLSEEDVARLEGR